MNNKEREIERHRILKQLDSKLDLILKHLGLNEKGEPVEEKEDE